MGNRQNTEPKNANDSNGVIVEDSDERSREELIEELIGGVPDDISKLDFPCYLRREKIPYLPNFPLLIGISIVVVRQEILFQGILKHNPGVFLGEQHDRAEIRENLIELLPALERLGVKRLYLEAVNANQQPVLDRFNSQGDNLLDVHDLILENINGAYGPADYTRVIEMARAHNIDVFGIDVPNDKKKGLGISMRLTISNPQWCRTIVENEITQDGGKYMVLGGANHANHRPVHEPSSTPVSSILGIPTIRYTVSDNAAAPNIKS